MIRKDENIVGEKFGRLTVISYHHTDETHKRCWLCKCDCGNETIVSTSALTSGNTKGCGCGRGQHIAINRYKNEFDIATSTIYNRYQTKAKLRNIDFNLRKEDFIKLMKGSCHYCGIESSHSFDNYKGKFFESPVLWNGIDRIDSTKGYTLENCVSCCETCNQAKNDRTEEQFRSWVKRLYINMYHKTTNMTPGQLIDSLITTDMKCWWSQEKLLDTSLTEKERLAEAIRTQELNAKRTKLIRNIDYALDFMEDTNTEKTYDKDEKK